MSDTAHLGGLGGTGGRMLDNVRGEGAESQGLSPQHHLEMIYD